MRVFLHFDCVPLCFCKNFRRSKKEGVRHLLNESETVFEAEKFQCVDFLLSV